MTDAPKIVLHYDDPDTLARRLVADFPGAEFRVCDNYAALPALVAEYGPDVVYSVRFAGTQGFPREALTGTGGPSWIANGGVGTDHLGPWDPGRTIVTNAAGVAAGMMAEYVFGGFLHFTLDVPGLQRDKAARAWNARRVRPLAGQTLLIIGLGHTGRAVAARAKAFGMRVLGTRARPSPMDNVDEVHAAADLRQLLPRADFVVVSTPLTPATHGLLGAEEIAALKHGTILADVSRGGVVDQAALDGALQSGQVAAAVLDVFEVEPLPAESPLWARETVLISPHCSSVYPGWETASFDLFLENFGRRIRGEALLNVVNPSRGY